MIELRTLSAEDLLAQPDVGRVPWVPLTQFEGSPETILQRCRDRIDREGTQNRSNLLAGTQVFTSLRFPAQDLLEIFGGTRAMIESPLLQKFEAEVEQRTRQNDIRDVLRERFKQMPPALEAGLRQVKTEEHLHRLLMVAVTCADMAAFEQEMQSLTPPPETSTRRRKRKA